MYFWRIKQLKAEMIQQPLTDREVVPYLIASLVVIGLALAAASHLPATSTLDDYFSVFNTVALGLGTYYIYLQNQGANGQHLLQRYIVIGWVIGIRWLVAYLVGTFIITIGVYFSASLPIEASMVMLLIFNVIAVLVYYWLVGHHVRDVALRTSTVQPPVLPSA